MKNYAIAFLIGVAVTIGTMFYLTPKTKPIPASVSQTVSVTTSQTDQLTQKKSLTKEYNCPNGALSKETVTEEQTAKKEEVQKVADQKKSVEAFVPKRKFALMGGGGIQAMNVKSLSDAALGKLNVQLAGGVELFGYQSFVASDMNVNHNIYFLKVYEF